VSLCMHVTQQLYALSLDEVEKVNALPESGPAFVIGLPLIVETRLLVSQAS
jgi:hypothetical protein